MTVPAAKATTRACFLDFPARAYLEKYYGAVGEENAAMLRAILAGLSPPPAVSPRVIEVGGGPSLFSLMAMAAVERRRLRRVTFTDIAAANLAEVRWWLDDDPRQFSYTELLSWLEAEVGADPLVITESLRASPWDLVRFDWLASDAPNWHGTFDVVSSHFFAESATDDWIELLDLLGKVGRLGRPGATIILSFLCRSRGYRVGGREFPAFPLREDRVLDVLGEAGMSLIDPQVRAAPTEDPNSQPGYDGMVFVAGRLACAPVDGKQAGLSPEPMTRGSHSAGADGLPPYSQRAMPYVEALGDFAERATRLHVPGHKGGACTSPQTVSAVGERVFAIDVPGSISGIDRGPEPTALERSRVLAAEAWGARRTWFLTNGASQANHIACLALAGTGDEVVVQRNAHSSVIHGLLLSGLRPTFAAPELDPELGIAHCLTPGALYRALARTPDAVGAMVVSPSYFGATADVRALTAVAHEHGVPLVVDEAWGAHLAFHESLPEDALSAGADLVVSSTHKILGSLSQSARLHLGQGAGPWLDERAIDRARALVESTSPSSVLLASLDAARHDAAVWGRERLDRALGAVWAARSALRGLTGLRVVDERIVGRPGVHGYDPLRLVLDVRATGLSGFELATELRRSDIHLELATEALIVALFGMGEEAGGYGARLVEGLGEILGTRSEVPPQPESYAASPTWGPLAMSPRQAFFGEHQVVAIEESINRICAELVAAYPPGIANLLPGERVTAPVLEQLRLTLEHGGYLRGASDPSLRTLCVVDRRRRPR